MAEAAIPVPEAYEKLLKATRAYEEAREKERRASKEETILLNTLNDAQKLFDQAVKQVHMNPPNRSDWNTPRRELCGND